MIHYLMDVSWFLYRGAFALHHVYPEYSELHFLCKKIESLLKREDACLHLCLDGATQLDSIVHLCLDIYIIYFSIFSIAEDTIWIRENGNSFVKLISIY